MHTMRYNLHITTVLEHKYTEIARDYSRTIALLNATYAPFYLSHIPIDTRKILDVGCGSGDTLLALSTKLRNISYYGIDPIQNFVDLAKEKLPNSTILKASVEEVPFEDGSFDFILSHVVFQHVDRQKALMEIKRILKPHGRVVITEVLAKQPAQSILESLRYLVNQKRRNIALLLRHGPMTFFRIHQYAKSSDWHALTAIHRSRRFTYSELDSFYNQQLHGCRIVSMSSQLVSVVWDKT